MKQKVDLAAPWFSPKQAAIYNQVVEKLRTNPNYELMLPRDFVMEDGYAMDNFDWACHVFEHDSKTENDEERVSYELTDTLQIGTYQTTFYVESNIMWEVKDIPEWIQLANETSQATNRKDDGTFSFAIDNIMSPQELKPEAVSKIHIRLSSYADISRAGLAELLSLMARFEGDTPTVMEIDGCSGEELQLKSTSFLNYTRSLLGELEELDVVEKAWVS